MADQTITELKIDVEYLDRERERILGLLSELQEMNSRIGDRLDIQKQRLDGHDGRLDTQKGRLDAMKESISTKTLKVEGKTTTGSIDLASLDAGIDSRGVITARDVLLKTRE